VAVQVAAKGQDLTLQAGEHVFFTTAARLDK